MVRSRQASLDAFLRKQPAADDANLNEEPEEKSIARSLVITTRLILNFISYAVMASFQSHVSVS